MARRTSSSGYGVYLRRALLTALAFWLLLAGANIVVDPTNAYRLAPPQPWNSAKREVELGGRLRAVLLLKLRQADTLVLGSSRTKGLIGAFPPAAGRVLILPAGGFALRELLWLAPLLERAAPRRLVLPLDIFMLNASRRLPDFKVARLDALFWPDVFFRHLASWPSLERSWATVAASLRPPPHPPARAYRTALLAYFLSDLERALRHDPADLARFESLLRRLQDNGTEVMLFLNPTHADLALALAAIGGWDRLEALKRALTELAERRGLALWDFQGFYHLSQVANSSGGPAWRDISHFQPGVGERLLRRLDGSLESDFGRRLTADSLAAHFVEQRRRGACYLAAHPALREELAALAAAEPAVTLAPEPWFGAAAAAQAASGCQPLPR